MAAQGQARGDRERRRTCRSLRRVLGPGRSQRIAFRILIFGLTYNAARGRSGRVCALDYCCVQTLFDSRAAQELDNPSQNPASNSRTFREE